MVCRVQERDLPLVAGIRPNFFQRAAPCGVGRFAAYGGREEDGVHLEVKSGLSLRRHVYFSKGIECAIHAVEGRHFFIEDVRRAQPGISRDPGRSDALRDLLRFRDGQRPEWGVIHCGTFDTVLGAVLSVAFQRAGRDRRAFARSERIRSGRIAVIDLVQIALQVGSPIGVPL